MGRIAYFNSELNKHADVVHNETGKPIAQIKLSMILDFIKYGASPANYDKFGFYSIDNSLKRTFITNRVSSHLIKKYNNPQFAHIFEDKTEFAKVFNEYFNRKWLFVDTCTEYDWKKFVEHVGESKVICKPIGEAQGHGIKVINPSMYDFKTIKHEFSGCIAEEYIIQHHELAAFYDKAVNCLRIITVLKNGIVNVVVANMTFGFKYEIANASYGGITAEVDICTGELISNGGQFGHHVFETHPYSGKRFKGYVLPYWDKTIDMVKTCGMIVPQIGYVGWDIAITEHGPLLIEGNTTPGYTYFQIPDINEEGKGVMGAYELLL